MKNLLPLWIKTSPVTHSGKFAAAGNSFAASHERWCGGRLPHRSPDRCPWSVVASEPGIGLLEQPFAESGYPVVGAFNDMALHLFPSADVLAAL